jgi:WD40 repeat protein
MPAGATDAEGLPPLRRGASASRCAAACNFAGAVAILHFPRREAWSLGIGALLLLRRRKFALNRRQELANSPDERVRTSTRYNAFISYNRSVDADVAPAFQSALQRFAKPWYRMRAVRVFRDDSDLRNEPLRSAVTAALNRSEFFVLLASPAAAESPWVADEVEYWRQNKVAGHLLIVLTDGALPWSDQTRDFDWEQKPAVPRSISGAFDEEPRWSDIRKPKREGQLSLSNPEFRSAVADVAASLHHVEDKSVIIGEEARQHRRTVRLAIGTMILLAALAIAALLAAIYARNERDVAVKQRNFAQSRELASSALSELKSDPELSLLLAREAARRAPTAEAERALRFALTSSRVRLLLLHAGPVTGATFSPDGKRIVTSSEDGTAVIWDAVNGRKIVTLRHPGKVFDVAVNPDGNLVATTFYDRRDRGGVALWRMYDGHRIATQLMPGAGAHVTFSPDGTYLMSLDALGRRAVWWQADSNGLKGDEAALPNELGDIDSWDFSGDGSRVVTTVNRFDPNVAAYSDPLKSIFVQVRHAGTERVETTLRGHDSIGVSAVLSPDGRLIATTGFDNATRIWSPTTGRIEAVLRGHDDLPQALAFSFDGKLLATGAKDGTARVWDTRTWHSILVLRGHTAPVTAVAFDPHSQRLLTASEDGTARVWDIQPPARIAAPIVYRHFGSDLSDNAALAVTTSGRGTATVWDIAHQRRIRSLAATQPIYTALIAPDGKHVVTSGVDGLTTIWDVTTGNQIGRFATVKRAGNPVFSPDGRFVAAAIPGGAAVWSTSSAREVARVRAGTITAWIAVVALSSDAREVFGRDLGAVDIWDTQKRRRAAKLSPHHFVSDVDAASLTNDGKLLAVADDHYITTVWDVEAKKPIAVLRGHTSWISSVTFSPDHTHVLTASHDRTARVWDMSTGDGIILRDHTGEVTSARFSADGTLVVTTSGDNAIRVWDATTGQLVTIVYPGLRSVYDAAIQGTSRSIVAIGYRTKPVTIQCELCAHSEGLIRFADRRITRNFTDAERQRYLHQR